jgi:hypothetical protein
MIKINYKSDFKINEKSETVALEVPFVFSYYVFDSKKYVVSFDGHNYVNCERKEDGSLDVIFNQPDFGIGHLKVERKYAVDDTAFADGVFDVVTVDKTDIFITSGKTFETYVETLVVPPYLKGDKGDPMTWSTMTETEREELVHDVAEAIDPEMVMTENEKSRQEAEQGRQTAEQQRSTTFNTLKGEMQSAITAGNAAAGNAQKVVDEYDEKVAEQDGKLTELGSEVSKIDNRTINVKPVNLFEWGRLNALGFSSTNQNYSINEFGHITVKGTCLLDIPITHLRGKKVFFGYKGKSDNREYGTFYSNGTELNGIAPEFKTLKIDEDGLRYVALSHPSVDNVVPLNATHLRLQLRNNVELVEIYAGETPYAEDTVYMNDNTTPMPYKYIGGIESGKQENNGAKYPPDDEKDKRWNLVTRGYEDGHCNFYNALHSEFFE